MRFTHKLIGVAGVSLAFVGVGTAAAVTGSAGAQTPPAIAPAAKPLPSEASTSSDTDSVQQGDQNTRDSVGTPKSHAATVKPESATAETAEPAASEANNSDGPGGHQDSGDHVDHQFDGQE